jgi:glycosyltransferase involved in cell wall biosynthesis
VTILYFADVRFPLERANGIQTMETCYALAERGHRVHLVVRPDTQTPARDPFEYYGRARHDRLIVERAPLTGGGLPSLARRIGYLAFATGRAFGSGRADVAITRDATVASLLVALPSRPPIVYESHGYGPDVAAALPSMLSTARPPSASKLARMARREAAIWSKAEGYITITAGLAGELTKRFGARDRLAVVPDGTHVPALPNVRTSDPSTELRVGLKAELPNSRSPEPPNSRLVVAYAGHLYAWKGVDLLLEAVALVPDVQALIVGGHEQESDLGRLREAAQRLGIADRVTFTGLLAPSAVPAQLARADILALPNPPSAISTHATSPLKLFEYMAAGRAIVASDLPAIREVLQHDVTAWLVPAGDPQALAAGIAALAQDPDRRHRLADAARRQVAEYSWSRRAEKIEALLTEVLSAHR